MSTYRIPAISQLSHELHFTPEKLRKLQVKRLEELLIHFETTHPYPFEFIYFTITGVNTEENAGEVYEGLVLRDDLLVLLRDLSKSVSTSPEEVNEPVWTAQDVARRLNLSPRTIRRWQSRSLVTRMFVFDGQGRRVGVRQSALAVYLRKNRDAVRRASHFSNLSPQETSQIVSLARRYASEDSRSLSAVVRLVSSNVGRAPETVRYTLRKYDHTHPRHPVFAPPRRKLTDSDHLHIYTQYVQGTGIPTIARQYHRQPSTIYRVINRLKSKEILERKVQFIPNEMFDLPSVEEEIFRPFIVDEIIHGKETHGAWASHSENIPDSFRPAYVTPLLSKEEERDLFRAYNFCKYQISKFHSALMNTSGSQTLSLIEEYEEKNRRLKDRIIRSNLGLVISIANRHVGPMVTLAELVSDGNVCLMRAVEKFNFARGTKFSTYATWCLMREYARTVPDENYRLHKVFTSDEAVFDHAVAHNDDALRTTAALREVIAALLRTLTGREEEILRCRFGIGEGHIPGTLEEIGKVFGITRERVRQIEAAALAKLRSTADLNAILETSR